MPAPAGGGVVSLTTDNTSVIHVPANVTIAQGDSTNSFDIGTSTVSGLPTGGNVFTVTTFAVGNNTSVTITAFFDTTTSANLTVTAGAPPSPTPPQTLLPPSLLSPPADARFAPGTNIVFDWGDVTGAVSYTIQIDD
jgi:hypothetical protein